jgi:hypothetical protein
MNTRQWITAASKKLGREDDLRLVEPHRFKTIIERIISERTNLSKDAINGLCWWESLKEPVAQTVPREPISFIKDILPPDEPIWFVAEDSGKKKIGNFWLYEGTPSAACAILQECPAFEYYVVEKKMGWLICENHHGCVIASGEPIVSTLSEA